VATIAASSHLVVSRPGARPTLLLPGGRSAFAAACRLLVFRLSMRPALLHPGGQLISE